MSPNYAETVLLKLSVKKARVPIGFRPLLGFSVKSGD